MYQKEFKDWKGFKGRILTIQSKKPINLEDDCRYMNMVKMENGSVFLGGVSSEEIREHLKNKE